jgi:perosamine synthetase
MAVRPSIMASEIPLASPEWALEEEQALLAVLRSGRWSFGEKLPAFERELAALIGTKAAVATNSGTMALQIALEALGIGPGAEVITPAYTFVGSVNAILGAGAQPVLVDVDATDLNISPTAIEAAIGPRTRAILPVHLFGRPAPMAPILALAQRHRLAVIEDACEAIGARWQGRPVGGLGDLGAVAFYPNKPVATGEGGALLGNDPGLLLRCRQLRNQGFDPDSGSRLDDLPGHSARLSEFHAALGRAQLLRLRVSLLRRRALAEAYRQRLAGEERLQLPAPVAAGDEIAWFTYPIRLQRALAPRRDAVIAGLRALGIGCNVYFPPVHQLPFHRGRHRCLDLAVTEDAGRRCLALPLFPAMNEGQVDRVCAELLRLVGGR